VSVSWLAIANGIKSHTCNISFK